MLRDKLLLKIYKGILKVIELERNVVCLVASADIRIALFTGYPNYYPYPTETPIPYPYSYPGENIRIRIRIQNIRELSDPKGIRIRFYPERTETIRSVFIPSGDDVLVALLTNDDFGIVFALNAGRRRRKTGYTRFK